MDDAVRVVPIKHIVHRPPLEVFIGCDCRVKWSDNRHYDAVVLCVLGDAALMAKAENDWTVQESGDHREEQPNKHHEKQASE